MIEVRRNSNCTTGFELHATCLILEGVMDDVVEPAAADFQLSRILAALADPQRLATVRYVALNGESWCTQVMQEAGLAMTKSTFSHHLRILREAGVLTKRIQGTRGYTRLRKDDLDRRFPGLMDSVIAADTVISRGDDSPGR
jgi:DNA-binding transcriptional ArsR family regulator